MSGNLMKNVIIGGETRLYLRGTRYEEIVKDFTPEGEEPAILVKVNGKVSELHKLLKEDCTLEMISVSDPEGFAAFRRTAVLILTKAIYDVAGLEKLEKVVSHFALGAGIYFTVHGDVIMDQAFLDQVKQKMQELIEAKRPIRKRNVDIDEAIEILHKQKMYDKEKLFHFRRVSHVNLYKLEEFEDYFYGHMASHAGYVKNFELIPYQDGFILQLPRITDMNTVPPFKRMDKIFRIQIDSERWGEKLHISSVGELNEQITREGIQNLILIQEAYHEAKISEIAEEIARAGNKKFIMIAGPSSSGKTTFSHRLSTQLTAHGMKPHPIALDNYFVDREHTPVDEFGEKDYECLGALDVEQFNQDMLALLRGECVEMPVFNFKTGLREYHGDFLKLDEDDILVIEGIHGLNDQLSYALPKESKYKIYISALTQLNIDEHNRIPTTDGRMLRRMVRDARTRGFSARDTIFRWPSVRRGEEKNIFPYQEDADAMFNSALIYELACLKVYAEPLLFGIPKDTPEYPEAKRLLKFLDYFLPVPSDQILNNSILREFVGGSCFNV